MSEINVKKEEDDNSDSDNDILMAGLNKEVKALEDDLPSCPSIQNSQIEELKKSLNMEPRSDNKVNTTLSSGALTLMKSPYLEAPLCISDIEGQSQKWVKPPMPEKADSESESESFEPTPRLLESKGYSDSSLLMMSEDVITIEDTY